MVEKHAEQPTGHTPEAFIASITKLIRKITDNANIPTKSKIALVANYIDEFRETGPVGSQLAHVCEWRMLSFYNHIITVVSLSGYQILEATKRHSTQLRAIQIYFTHVIVDAHTKPFV